MLAPRSYRPVTAGDLPRGIDRVARLFEGGYDLLIEDFVVLDNEKAHVSSFP